MCTTGSLMPDRWTDRIDPHLSACSCVRALKRPACSPVDRWQRASRAPPRRRRHALDGMVGCLDRAFDGAENTLAGVFRKPNAGTGILPYRLMSVSVASSTGCWMVSTASSRHRNGPDREMLADTALRDFVDLVQRGLLRKNEGGGRSTSYSLADVQM